MSSEDHRHVQELLGAYLLGDLDEGEREAVRAHLDDCEICRAEMRELGPVVAALAHADPERIDEESAPPEGLEERTLGPIFLEFRRARRRKWLGRSALAAAAALVIVAVGLAAFAPSLFALLTGPSLEPVAFSQVPPSVEAEANLISHTWGTETRLVASGLEDGQTYSVALLSEDGEEVSSGAFIGTGDEPLECNLTAPLLRENVSALEVRTLDGETVLFGELPEESRSVNRGFPLAGVPPWAILSLWDEPFEERLAG